jgi:Zn-dependent oligopeptidase
VSGVFYNLSGAESNPAREALMRDLAPKMSAFASEVTNNKALFAGSRRCGRGAMRWGWSLNRCAC